MNTELTFLISKNSTPTDKKLLTSAFDIAVNCKYQGICSNDETITGQINGVIKRCYDHEVCIVVNVIRAGNRFGVVHLHNWEEVR